MPAKRTDIDADHLYELYRSGMSTKAIGKQVGCAPQTVARILREEKGVRPRSRAEAQVLRAATEPADVKLARYDRSSAALSGRRMSPSALRQRAITKQRCASQIGKHELDLTARIRAAGIEVTPQLAVGPYNLDLACGGVLDIEIHTAMHGPHLVRRARVEERVNYLSNAGWFLLYVWAPDGMTPVDLDQVVSLAEVLCSNPTAIRGQYLVLRCHGESGGIVGRPNSHHEAVVPAASGVDRLV
ncbi:helix-turn-helix domain-containing protein [Mycolicibacterium goodii]|nr:helix-turn-helix domain-containing protein [Mycolicibacterium goodii]